MVLICLIVLSYLLWHDSIFSLSQAAINSNSSPAVVATLIFGLLALDIVLPTPSSLLSVVAGVYFGVTGGALLIFAGMSAGCLLGYYLGRSSDVFFGKHFSLKTNHTDKMKRLLGKWGTWSLTLTRPIPVLAETSVIMAGIQRVPLRVFALYTLPANALIAIFYSVSAHFAPQLF